MSAAISYLLLNKEQGVSTGEAERRFIGHKASFLMEGKNLFSHTYFSPQVSNATREKILRECVANGDDTIYVYLTNQGDYRSKFINPCLLPFDSDDWGARLYEPRMARWESEIEKMISMGLYPVFWLFADDSPVISGKSPEVLGGLTDLLVKRFDQYAIGWVGALEANEHMGFEQMKAIYAALNQNTSKPKGVHLTPMGHNESGFWKLADYYFLQTNEPDKPEDVDTLKARVKVSIAYTKKKVVLSEYHINSYSKEAKSLGRAGMDAGADATGNGR